jgi:hypothetical protein
MNLNFTRNGKVSDLFTLAPGRYYLEAKPPGYVRAARSGSDNTYWEYPLGPDVSFTVTEEGPHRLIYHEGMDRQTIRLVDAKVHLPLYHWSRSDNGNAPSNGGTGPVFELNPGLYRIESDLTVAVVKLVETAPEVFTDEAVEVSPTGSFTISRLATYSLIYGPGKGHTRLFMEGTPSDE